MSITQYSSIPRWAKVSRGQWDDWHWQLKNTVGSIEELESILDIISLELPSRESRVISEISQAFEMKLTPHIVLNMCRAIKAADKGGIKALINTFVPAPDEHGRVNDNIDGIGEELGHSKPAPLVTNFYRTRVLLFATNTCSSYCRFCFRRRKIGRRVTQDIERATNQKYLQKALDYIKKNTSIREVIISGGDPLTLSDERLLSLLRQLRNIKHIKVLRIDTKVITSMPQRITPMLVGELKKFRPIYIVGNFLHSIELTPETLKAASLLIDDGIPVLSHTALLKGINDRREIIADLMWNLYINRVFPYYLIQFIPTKWTEHFRVSISKGLQIMEYLQGRLSGIANPTYIVYLPDGAGKVAILPNCLLKHTKKGYYFRNWKGKKVFYKEPADI